MVFAENMRLSDKSELYNKGIYYCSYLGQCIYEPKAYVAPFIESETHSHHGRQWSYVDLPNNALSKLAQCNSVQPNTEILLVIWNWVNASFK